MKILDEVVVVVILVKILYSSKCIREGFPESHIKNYMEV